MNELLTWVLVFGILFALFFLLVNFVTRGFFFNYLSVFISRGRKKLVRVKSVDGFYHSKGWIQGGEFKWFDRHTKLANKNKMPNTIQARPEYFVEEYGVKTISVHEDGTVIMPTGGSERLVDPTMEEILIQRALLLGMNQQDLKLLLILTLILGVITLLALVFVVIKTGQITSIVQAIQSTQISTQTISGGVAI